MKDMNLIIILHFFSAICFVVASVTNYLVGDKQYTLVWGCLAVSQFCLGLSILKKTKEEK